MDITLPEALEPIVQRRVKEGGYVSAEEYLRDLILADDEPPPEWQKLTDQERAEVERIDQQLLKSLDSGPPIVVDDAYWEKLKRRARERRADGS
jgi:Arc/MetJ-type ribon-helix-helix transcriptional regulator